MYAAKEGDWIVKDCEQEGEKVGKYAWFRGRDVEAIRMVTAWGDLEDSPDTSKAQSRESSLDPLPAISELLLVHTETFPKRAFSPLQVRKDLSTPTQSLSEHTLTAIQRINPGYLHWTPPSKPPEAPDSLLDMFIYSAPSKFSSVDVNWPLPRAKPQGLIPTNSEN